MSGPAFATGKNARAVWILFLFGMCALAGQQEGGADWVLYSASREKTNTGGTLKDWYKLNRIKPAPQAEADIYYFFDRNSLASNSPCPGGIRRVWEKSVAKGTIKDYFETKQDIEQQEEQKLKRKLTALDQAWIFPLVIKKATRESHTLFEINCDNREFIILEVNHYDIDGNRMSRETNMDRETWYPIEPGTVMEALFQHICQ